MHTVVTRDIFTLFECVGTMDIVEAPKFGAQTIEQPRNNDIPDHSCAPVGVYQLVPHKSGHLHEDDGVTPLNTYALVNPALGVTHYISDPIPEGCAYPHRATILVHPDNLADTLLGCIGPGTNRQQTSTGWEVTNSRVAFKQWRDILGTNVLGHTLEIREA